MVPDLGDRVIDAVEGIAQRDVGRRFGVRFKSCQSWAQQASVGAVEEQGGAQSGVSDVIAAGLWDALNQAVKWDLLARNAAALVDVPRVVKREILPLDPEQARRLLTHTA